MKKGKFQYHLKNDDLVTEYEGICLYHEDKDILIYKEENGTQTLFDLRNWLLTRENDEMFLVLDFSGGQSYIDMKKMSRKMKLDLKVKYKEYIKNSLMVNYILSGQNEFILNMKWTLDGE